MLRPLYCLVLAASLLNVGGCSWVFVKTVDNSPRPARRYCTNTRLLPALDGLGAIMSASAAGNRLLGRAHGDLLYNGVTAVVLAYSSYYGFSETNRCRTLQATGRDPGATGAWEPSDGIPNPIAGCGSDRDCKGSRVCRSGSCVDR